MRILTQFIIVVVILRQISCYDLRWTGDHFVAHVSLELSTTCLPLLSRAGITDVYYHIQEESINSNIQANMPLFFSRYQIEII